MIFETNLLTSRAAGRYRQLTDPELLAVRPYWRYIHADGVMHPRPQHQHWGNIGLTLRYDHPFWKTHFPPNGWGCRCTVMAVREPVAGDATEPPAGWNERNDKGNLAGVDKGFDYAPGANANTSLRQIVQDKLISYPPAITRALSHEVNRYLNAHEPIANYVARVLADRSPIEPLWIGFVENFDEVSAATGRDVKGFSVLIPDGTPRHVERSHGHDGGDQRPVLVDDFLQVATVLAAPEKLLPRKTSINGQATIVAWKTIGGELFRCVFEIRPGRNNRSLALLSMVIKRAGGG